MAIPSSMSERRTAVRMLQAQCVENDLTGCEAGTRACNPLPANLRTNASRRRSACFLLPPTDIFESCRGDTAARSCIGRCNSSSTAPTSPAPTPSRLALVPALDCTGAGPDATLSPSPPGFTDSDGAPYHLSVPLTLLSLHNGGLRHSPRGARDASPVSCLLVSREGSIICHPADIEGSENDLAGSSSTSDGLGSGAPCNGRCQLLSECSSVTGSRPRSTSSLILRSAPLPGVTSPTMTILPPSATSRGVNAIDVTRPTSARPPTASGAAVQSCSSAAPLSPTGPFLDRKSPPLVAESPFSGGGNVGGGVSISGSGNIVLPPHLCSHRPPTPVSKEDDLVASMRHMTSPTRRRSRFASTADSPLLAAAAAAIAAEEADLMDSTRGGAGIWSSSGMVSEPRSGRRNMLVVVSDSSTSSNNVNYGGSSGGINGGGTGSTVMDAVAVAGPIPRAVATAATGAVPLAESPVPRLSSVSMTWRSASELVPVPEEPLRPQSRTGPGGFSAAPKDGDAATTAAVPGPSLPSGRNGSGVGVSPPFAISGSFPRTNTPVTGIVEVAGFSGGALLGRRLRNISCNSFMLDPTPEVLCCAGLSHTPSFRCATSFASSATGGGGGGCNSGGDGAPIATSATTNAHDDMANDSLSSFMHSFGPGTPAGERHCPAVATPLVVEGGTGPPAGMGLGLGPVGLGMGVAGGGRITAR